MIKENLRQIKENIAAAAQRSGREIEDIRIMAVSKTQPIESIQEVYDLGIRLFGENRVAEASEKFDRRFPGAELHLIGHIQRNKARQAVQTAVCIQSLDSLRTLEAIEKYALEQERSMDILVEIHTSGEDAKHGIREKDEALNLIQRVCDSPALKMKGLMTMAPFTSDEGPVRSSFSSLYEFREECIPRFGGDSLKVLSMGMSGDYEIAVEEGATLLRIGTALFGVRN